MGSADGNSEKPSKKREKYSKKTMLRATKDREFWRAVIGHVPKDHATERKTILFFFTLIDIRNI